MTSSIKTVPSLASNLASNLTSNLTHNLVPSAVRKIILDEHTMIRTQLQNIENLLHSKNDSELKKTVQAFNIFFLKHLANEERILLPLLQTIDSWGPVRVERMGLEHIEQTRELKRLNSLVQDKNFSEYADALQLFVESIYKDMAHEEIDFLSATLLKDDVITAGDCS